MSCLRSSHQRQMRRFWRRKGAKLLFVYIYLLNLFIYLFLYLFIYFVYFILFVLFNNEDKQAFCSDQQLYPSLPPMTHYPSLPPSLPPHRLHASSHLLLPLLLAALPPRPLQQPTSPFVLRAWAIHACLFS